MAGKWVRVAAVDEIPPGEIRGFKLGRERIAICHADEGFFAVADECSHDGAPISSGRVRRGNIVCPRHGAKFDLQTGEVKGPPAVVGIDTFTIKVDGGDIFVLLD